LVRRCTNPTTVKGFEFPLNMAVAIDVLTIHNDPELWGPEDPKKYDLSYNFRDLFQFKRLKINFFLK
jgi:hypothetical protein